MNNAALALVEDGTTKIAKQTEFDAGYVQTVKDTYAKGATDSELQLL